MKKIYVLDTNVLLHDPNAIYSFEDNEIVIPLVVIEEVDGQKRRQDEVGRHARVVTPEMSIVELNIDHVLDAPARGIQLAGTLCGSRNA